MIELVRRVVGTGGVVIGRGGVVVGRGGGDPSDDPSLWDNKDVGRVVTGTGGGRAILSAVAMGDSVFTVAGLARAGL